MRKLSNGRPPGESVYNDTQLIHLQNEGLEDIGDDKIIESVDSWDHNDPNGLRSRGVSSAMPKGVSCLFIR